MKQYNVSISTNKRSYEASEIVSGNIYAQNEDEAIDNFFEMLKDKNADNNNTLDFDNNYIYEVDEDGDRSDEYYIRDSAAATII